MTEDSHSSQEPTAPREPIRESATVPDSLSGKRFDAIAAQLFPAYSRSRLQSWIESGQLTVDGQSGRNKQKLLAGAKLAIDAEFVETTQWQPEPMALDIVFEDAHILVLNKPANCVVHPAAGQQSGTLANAVLAHCPGNAEIPRCGIVHRLDKDTTGLLVVAKSLAAHSSLVEQLQQRTVKRLYRAIVCGKLIAGSTIDLPIGRHPVQRTKMAVIQQRHTGGAAAAAKPAITHYRIAQRYTAHTELLVQLETGRTHQIRVHMAHIHHPLLGDATYNPRYKRVQGISDTLDAQLRSFHRQALHATALSFSHPVSGKDCHFEAPPPEDYLNILEALAETALLE